MRIGAEDREHGYGAAGNEVDGSSRDSRPDGGASVSASAEERVYGITTAARSHSDDISRRQRQYIYTMLFRVVSIIVVALVPGISWPIKIALMLVATVIPFVAVVRANGGPAPERDPTNLIIGSPPGRQLDEGRAGLPAAEQTIRGEAWAADAAADNQKPLT